MIIIIRIIVIIIVNEKERDTDYLRFQRDRAPPDVIVLNTAG